MAWSIPQAAVIRKSMKFFKLQRRSVSLRILRRWPGCWRHWRRHRWVSTKIQKRVWNCYWSFFNISRPQTKRRTGGFSFIVHTTDVEKVLGRFKSIKTPSTVSDPSTHGQKINNILVTSPLRISHWKFTLHSDGHEARHRVWLRESSENIRCRLNWTELKLNWFAFW